MQGQIQSKSKSGNELGQDRYELQYESVPRAEPSKENEQRFIEYLAPVTTSGWKLLLVDHYERLEGVSCLVFFW